MNNAWVLLHVSGQLYRVLNNTGQVARNVTFSIQGAMVAGVIASSAWQHTVDEIAYGAGIEEVFSRAWGDGPAISITWTDATGEELSYLIPFDR